MLLSAPDTSIQARAPLDAVEAACEEFGISALKPRVEACRGWFAREGDLEVVVLGGFKAGKSSFLNSLARRPVLPVGALPVTAVITRLAYGPHEKATVTHLDGRREEISLDAVAAYVEEKHNPGNRRQAASVRVELPELKAYEGLCFVDTPGLGSVFTQNTATTRRWMPHVGATLVATSASHPLSEQDLALIHEALRFTPRLILLVTKVDLLADGQVREVSDFIERQLPPLAKEAIPVLPYSVLSVANGYRDRLEREVLFPLARNRPRERENIFRHKVLNLLGECVEYLGIGIAAAAQEDSKRTHLLDQVLGEKAEWDALQRELRLLRQDFTGRARAHVHGVLERHRDALERKLGVELPSRVGTAPMNLWRFCRAWEAHSREAFSRELGILSRAERGALLVPLIEARTAFDRVAENFRKRLDANLERALGLRMTRPQWKCETTEPEAPEAFVSSSFDIHIDLLWFLIPMRLFKGWVMRHFLRRIPHEVEANLSRLETEWTDAINRRVHELERQAETFMKKELATIEALLTQKPSATAAMERARDALRQARRKMEAT